MKIMTVVMIMMLLSLLLLLLLCSNILLDKCLKLDKAIQEHNVLMLMDDGNFLSRTKCMWTIFILIHAIHIT